MSLRASRVSILKVLLCAPLLIGVMAVAAVSIGAPVASAANPVPSDELAWGYGAYGELGNGTTTTNQTTPVAVSLPSGVTATATAGGAETGYAIGSDSVLYAWGSGTDGQLGNGTTTATQTTPVAVSLPTGVTATAIAAGQLSAYSLGSNGTVYAWGYGADGELGNGTTPSAISTPVAVSLPVGVTATGIGATGYTGYAMGSDGTLYAWGMGPHGELGNGSTLSTQATPVAVSLPSGVTATAIAGGTETAYALGSNGTLYAWGSGSDGELGNNTTNSVSTPAIVQIPTGVTVTAIAAGELSGYALGSNGTMYAWGSDTEGQLGNNSANDPQTTPVAVSLPSGVSATTIGASELTGFAIGSNGTLYAWGLGLDGNLGNGTTTFSQTTPVAVSLPTGVAPTSLGSESQSETGYAIVRPAVTLSQGTPTSASITPGAGFSGQLTVTNPQAGGGSLTWTTTIPSSGVTVSSSGAVNVPTSVTTPGTVTVSGTVSDTIGDAGNWSFTLTVTGTLCTPGYYSSTGYAPCTIAPPNTYVPTTGAIAPTPCPTGKINPNSGSTSIAACVAGSGPTITGFTPAGGPSGTVVTITGTILSDATTVSFNGVAATITSDTSTKITVKVPTGATTGYITVTVPSGSVTSKTKFTYTGPTITGFTPAGGPPGTVVTITGTNFGTALPGAGVNFNGIAGAVLNTTPTGITVKVPKGDTTGYITIGTVHGDTTSATEFTDAGPTITGFTPAFGPPNSVVTITGTDLLGAGVTFNGIAGTVASDNGTKITVRVPLGGAGDASGYIRVTTTYGSAPSATKFTESLGPPTITGFTPAGGPSGTVVTITGTNLSDATPVSFNGVAATITSDTSTKITVKVPTGATTGDITVTVPSGSVTSKTKFTYTGPTITGFTPAGGPPGTVVTITGTNFGTALPGAGVNFNGIAGAVLNTTPTGITVKVPKGDTTGYITIGTVHGDTTSATEFTDAGPTITGFTPAFGPPNSVVTITGTDLLGAGVTFNGIAGTVASDNGTKITVRVPLGGAGDASGYIRVTTTYGSAPSATKFTED